MWVQRGRLHLAALRNYYRHLWLVVAPHRDGLCSRGGAEGRRDVWKMRAERKQRGEKRGGGAKYEPQFYAAQAFPR